MMELLPNLLSRLLQYAQTLRRRDQANSLLCGHINSELAHSLARDVEEAVKLDDEHVKIGKTTINSIVRSEVVRFHKLDNLK